MNRSRQTIFLSLFFISGACGLIYEIVWSRLLIFVFGGTTFAITTVLGCFMGGLALGSYLAGRLIHRVGRPARLYGVLEIGIGLYCLAIPFLLDMALPMYRALANVSGESFFWLILAKVLVSTVVLVIPTAFMGATLPLLSQAFVQRSGEAGGAVARLYGVNTMGAFVGCAGTGFFLLPALGLSKSILLAALLNMAAGAIAVGLAATPSPQPREENGKRKKSRGAAADHRPVITPWLLLWLYGLSGFVAMAYQVAWTRALILAMGGSTYAFSAIVASFILGIALGSLLVSPWIGKIKHPLVMAGLLEGVIGLSALIVVPLFGEMPGLIQRLSGSEGATFDGVLTIEVLSVFGLLIVPTLCMGALLPLVCVVYETARRAGDPSGSGAAVRGGSSVSTGRSVGAVYASNAVGTIIGAGLTGFLLIPWRLVGMQRTIVIASVLSGIIGTVFVLSERSRRIGRSYGVVGAFWLAGIALISVTQPWSKAIMISGPYLGRATSELEVLFYREGIDTTVAVTSEGKESLTLRVNGKPDASTGLQDMRTQLLTGHIPMLLNPSATEICVIGLGSGITAGATLAHPVEAVDVAEISAGVIAAADYFLPYNNNALGDGRVALHRADGRNFLLMTERKYDVIISEPSNVWMSGVENLFTTEFLELARSRLKPGGIHGQWIQGYSISEGDFAAVVRTMSGVFPHIQVWVIGLQDYLIVGSAEPLVLDIENIYLSLPAINQMLSSIYINDPFQLAHYYIADGQHLGSWIADQEPLTDDRPRLEFSAPHYLLQSSADVIEELLNDAGGAPGLSGNPGSLLNTEFVEAVERARRARQYYYETAGAYREGDPELVLEGLLQMARHAPDDHEMIRAVALGMEELRESADTEAARNKVDAYYAEIVRIAPCVEPLLAMEAGGNVEFFWPLGKRTPPMAGARLRSMIEEASALAAKGEREKAVTQMKKTLRMFPYAPTALHMTGVWTLELEGPEKATPYLLKAWVLQPGNAETNFHLARAYSRRGDPDRALTFLQTAIDSGFQDGARIRSSHIFQRLGNDARFQQLLARVGG